MTIGTISIIIGVALLIFLKIFFKEDNTGNKETDHLAIDEDPWSDPGWSVLPGNLFNRKNK